MSRFNQDSLYDFLNEEIFALAKGDALFEYLAEQIEHEGRQSKTLENLTNFIWDGLEVLDASNRGPKDVWAGSIEIAATFAAALIHDDRSVDFNGMDRRMVNEIKSLSKTANDLMEGIADYQDDRGRRQSRDNGRGNRFGGQSSGGRYQEQRRSNVFNDRNDRGYQRGSGYGQQRSGRFNDRDGGVNPAAENRTASNAFLDRRNRNDERNREEQRNRHSSRDEAPLSSPGRYSQEAMPDPRRVNNPQHRQQPAYEKVEPAQVNKPAEWNKTGKDTVDGNSYSKKGNLLPSKTRPITADEVQSGKYDFSDPEVMLAIPLDPAITTRKVIWEIDAVSATFTLNEAGYRIFQFKERTDEEREELDRRLHEIPVLGSGEKDTRYHPQGNKIRNALGTSRFEVESAHKAREAETKAYNETVEAIKAENDTNGPDNQRPLPDAPEAADLKFDNIFRTAEPISAFSIGHARQLAMSKIVNKTADLTGEFNSLYNAYQFAAEVYEPVYTGGDVREVEMMLNALMGTGLQYSRHSSRSVELSELYENVSRQLSRIAPPLIPLLKKHVVDVINNIFKLDMGLILAISDFDDIKTLWDDMVAMEGLEMTKKFGEALKHHSLNFQLFKIGSGVEGIDADMDARTIYTVKRVDVVVAPMLANDLKLVTGNIDRTIGDTVYFVSKECTPVLWKIISGLKFSVDDTRIGLQCIYLADNSWVEVRKDFQVPGDQNFVVRFHSA